MKQASVAICLGALASAKLGIPESSYGSVIIPGVTTARAVLSTRENELFSGATARWAFSDVKNLEGMHHQLQMMVDFSTSDLWYTKTVALALRFDTQEAIFTFQGTPSKLAVMDAQRCSKISDLDPEYWDGWICKAKVDDILHTQMHLLRVGERVVDANKWVVIAENTVNGQNTTIAELTLDEGPIAPVDLSFMLYGFYLADDWMRVSPIQRSCFDPAFSSWFLEPVAYYPTKRIFPYTNVVPSSYDFVDKCRPNTGDGLFEEVTNDDGTTAFLYQAGVPEVKF